MPPASPLRVVVALLAAFVSGTLVATQSRVNGEFGQRLGDGFLAAFISFGSGLVLLGIVALFWRPGRRGIARIVAALRERRMPWWVVLGGAGGALFVLGQGLTVGVLGVALFTVAVVCGQTVSSLLIDHHGIGSMSPTRVTARRIAGAALAVVAVGVAVSGQIRADAPSLALLVPVAAGIAVGWQAAVNGQVRVEAESAHAATVGNFLVGTTVLGIALLVHSLIAGWHPTLPSEPWLYIGGALGTIFIAAQSIIVRTTGVLLMGLALLSGQLVASIVFDLVAPLAGRVLVPATIVGTVLTLVAVVVAVLPAPPRRATAS